jgi:hypothetical protein
MVHHGYVCDGCESHPIIGNRYKSLVQADYDLCECCFGKLIEAQQDCYKRFPEEPMSAMPQEQPTMLAKDESAKVEPERFNIGTPLDSPRTEPETQETGLSNGLGLLDVIALEEHASISESSASDTPNSQQSWRHAFEPVSDDDISFGEDLDVKTVASVEFQEDDVAVLVLENNSDTEQVPTKVDAYDDHMYENVHETAVLPHLKTKTFAQAVEGDVRSLSAEEWSKFHEDMQYIPQPLHANGCVFLGKFGPAGGKCSLIVQNDSEIHWPKDTCLRLVCGDGGGFDMLPLDAIEPGEKIQITMDFPSEIPGGEFARDTPSFWILTSGEYVFGDMFCVMRSS